MLVLRLCSLWKDVFRCCGRDEGRCGVDGFDLARAWSTRCSNAAVVLDASGTPEEGTVYNDTDDGAGGALWSSCGSSDVLDNILISSRRPVDDRSVEDDGTASVLRFASRVLIGLDDDSVLLYKPSFKPLMCEDLLFRDATGESPSPSWLFP